MMNMHQLRQHGQHGQQWQHGQHWQHLSRRRADLVAEAPHSTDETFSVIVCLQSLFVKINSEYLKAYLYLLSYKCVEKML